MELARHRLKVARYAIGITAVGAFAAFGAAARSSHPGTHSAAASSKKTTASAAEGTSDDGTTSSLDLNGSSSFGAASSAPSIQSGGS